MTLLETIRALDAPYVVWLSLSDRAELFGTMNYFRGDNGMTTCRVYGPNGGNEICVHPFEFGDRLVWPAEIDTMLAGLP